MDTHDQILIQAIKSNLVFWASNLASLYLYWSLSWVCKDLRLSIFVPNYKRERWYLSNYRAIDLLNTSSKLYARYLQWTLWNWLKQECLLKMDFLRSQLSLIRTLYSNTSLKNISRIFLYIAFVDFKQCFIPYTELNYGRSWRPP